LSFHHLINIKKSHTPKSNTLSKRYRPVNSDRALLRHIQNTAYGCLIPHLTRFTGMYCARPDRQHHLNGTFLNRNTLKWDITLAIADCKYRTPLPSRLCDIKYYTTKYCKYQEEISNLIKFIIFNKLPLFL